MTDATITTTGTRVSASDPLVRVLRDTLLSARNPDGGWGYYAGKQSRLEPTCWSLLALAAGGASPIAILRAWPRTDGLWQDVGNINYTFNGLVALVLAEAGSDSELSPTLVRSLIKAGGLRMPQNEQRQDNSLQGWGWVADTFSWVEPTATCVLGLKKLASRDAAARARVEEGERLLLDRVCSTGGWNYGNSNVLGKQLDAYIAPTALVLIALHDRAQAEPVNRSVRYLLGERLTERSALAVGLSYIALRMHGQTVDDLKPALESIWQQTRYLGNLHATAVALYALSAEATGFAAFHV